MQHESVTPRTVVPVNTDEKPVGERIGPEKPALEAALAQIELVRGEFRSCIGGLTKVVDLLRQAQREQKASEREVQSVRQTLRSLQSVKL
jgi:hypothetical protein